MIDIYNQTVDYKDDIRWDFSKCNFLLPYALVIIGGLIKQRINNGHQDMLLVDTMLPNVRGYLSYNGFLRHFSLAPKSKEINCIPFTAFPKYDKTNVDLFITKHIADNKNLYFTTKGKKEILRGLVEIFLNAEEHSNSPIGVYSSGQYMPYLHQLSFSVCDFGYGIPNTVKAYVGSKYSEEFCLRWALMEGTSTKEMAGIGRGYGLYWIKKLVRANEGKLDIISNGMHYCFDNLEENYYRTDYNFNGTMLSMCLNCDGRDLSIEDKE